MTRKSEIPRMRRRRVAMTLGRVLTRMFQLFVPNNSSGNFFLLPRPLCRFIVRGHRTARAPPFCTVYSVRLLHSRIYNALERKSLNKFLKSNLRNQLCNIILSTIGSVHFFSFFFSLLKDPAIFGHFCTIQLILLTISVWKFKLSVFSLHNVDKSVKRISRARFRKISRSLLV